MHNVQDIDNQNQIALFVITYSTVRRKVDTHMVLRKKKNIALIFILDNSAVDVYNICNVSNTRQRTFSPIVPSLLYQHIYIVQV